MKGIPQGRYTKEFREEAVKLVTEEKQSLPGAARRLSLPPSTLGNWVKAYKADRLGEVGVVSGLSFHDFHQRIFRWRASAYILEPNFGGGNPMRCDIVRGTGSERHLADLTVTPLLANMSCRSGIGFSL